MIDRAQLRVADADRERAAEALRSHYAAGRLEAEELEERLQRAYAAHTEGDLWALFGDLPEPHMAGAGAEGSNPGIASARSPVVPTTGRAVPFRARRVQLQRRVQQRAGGGLGAFALATGVWALTGSGYFWPVWVLVLVAISTASSMWHLWGPAPDLDRVERELARHGHHHDHHHVHGDHHHHGGAHHPQVEDGFEHQDLSGQDEQ
jgi:hypothetical protein